MRKLTTLRTVSEIYPIPGADAIEVAVVDGWHCVVKKNEFKVGDNAIYFEIDSILPADKPQFQFLMSRGTKNLSTASGTFIEGHRLRTIKLRGQISQGLLLPLQAAFSDPQLYSLEINISNGLTVTYRKGDEIFSLPLRDPETDEPNDLSEIFGIEKYEPVANGSLAGDAKGNYPSWLPKTDQERIQNCFNRIPPGAYIVEEKFEGSSISVYFSEGVGVTSRNIDLKIEQEGNTFVDVATKSKLVQAVIDAGSSSEAKFAIRGELLGPDIQGNIYKLNHHVIMIYDVFNGQRYLTYDERMEFLNEFILPFVDPAIVRAVEKIDMVHVDPANGPEERQRLVNYATGNSTLYPTLREGVVFKSEDVHRGQVFSFKSISAEYLIKSDAG